MLWLGHRLRYSQLSFALCISHARPSIIMTLHQIISLSLSLSLKKDELCDCISIPRFISTCQLYGVVLVLRSCHCVQRYLLDLKRCLIFSTKHGHGIWANVPASDKYGTPTTHWTWLHACPNHFFFFFFFCEK